MKSLNLDLLKRPAIYGTIVGVLILALVWWFAWESPEGAKLTSVNQQQQSLTLQVSSLNTTIGALKIEAGQVQHILPYLAFFQLAIPPLPDFADLTTQLYDLSVHTGTIMTSLNDSTTSATPGGYSTIPVTIVLTGSHNGVLAFIKGLYSVPRLITIQTLSMTPPSQAPSVIKPSKTTGFSASITATAYTTYVATGAAP